MTVSTTTDAPVDLEIDLLLLPFAEAPSAPFVEALSETLGTAVERAMKDFEAEEGNARVLYPERTVAPRVAFVGLGPASDLDAEVLRTAAAAGADGALNHEAESVACLMPAEAPLCDSQTAQALVEGFILGTYRYRRYKTADGFEGPSAFLMHVGDDHDRPSVGEGADRGRHLAEGTCTARDLVNRSPDEKTARQFAEAIAASGESGGDVGRRSHPRRGHGRTASRQPGQFRSADLFGGHVGAGRRRHCGRKVPGALCGRFALVTGYTSTSLDRPSGRRRKGTSPRGAQDSASSSWWTT